MCARRAGARGPRAELVTARKYLKTTQKGRFWPIRNRKVKSLSGDDPSQLVKNDGSDLLSRCTDGLATFFPRPGTLDFSLDFKPSGALP